MSIQKDPKIYVIYDWPACRGSNEDKVPTAISYDNVGNVKNWGYKAARDDVNIFRWIKIMLDPSHKFFNETPNVQDMLKWLEKLDKTTEDVVTDYLKCLWAHTITHLKRKIGEDFQEMYNLNVVLTVPAVWSAFAKDRTLRAAKQAGLPTASQLVTEPEAAALVLLKQKSEHEHNIKVVTFSSNLWQVHLH